MILYAVHKAVVSCLKENKKIQKKENIRIKTCRSHPSVARWFNLGGAHALNIGKKT